MTPTSYEISVFSSVRLLENAIFSYLGLYAGMDHFSQRTTFKTGDASPEAIHTRLVGIQKMTGLTGREIADRAGLKYTTFKSQEKSGSPSVKLMTYYLQAFHVDYNFILGGDPALLPADVLQAILAFLAEHEAT